MVKVKKVDIPKPKKTKLYWETLLLSWIPFIGLAFSLNGVIRSILRVVKSIKTKKIDKRAVAGTVLSSIALFISVVVISATLNPTPSVTLTNAETNTDDSSYTLTGKISNMENEGSKLTINGTTVPLDNGEFSHKVDLEEGDNIFTIVATNENGERKKVTTIHRTTQAEFAARAEAEKLAAEQRAEEKKRKQEEEKAVEEKKAQEKAKEEARIAKEKAEADAKAAAEVKAKAEAQAEHRAYIDGLAATYCSNHQGNRNIYVPQASSRDVWENPNKDLLTKYPVQPNCVTIMTFFVDTMPSDYIDNIINAKVGSGMNKAEVLAAWGWPNNNSDYSSGWSSSGTWMWDTGTCYYGVCSGTQYANFSNGKVIGTGRL